MYKIMEDIWIFNEKNLHKISILQIINLNLWRECKFKNTYNTIDKQDYGGFSSLILDDFASAK